MLGNKVYAYYEFIKSEGFDLFTVIILPEKEGKYPSVLIRNPYVDDCEDKSYEEIIERYKKEQAVFTENSYAVIIQHCRGRGKSEGCCVPFIYEHNDSLALQSWVRGQSFYNGEIFLYGCSYTSAVHLAALPFASDIKGAVLEVMTPDLRTAMFRNGVMKVGLFGIWYTGMYKAKQLKNKNYNEDSFLIKPFKNYSKTVFGESAEVFDEMMSHPDFSDEYYNKPNGYHEYMMQVHHTKTPILFTSGWYDIFVDGMITMWENMDKETRENCAFTICPYDHGMQASSHPFPVEKGMLREIAGEYPVLWFNSIRNGTERPIKPGKLTYYRLFEKGWAEEERWSEGEFLREIGVKSGEESFIYDPNDPVRAFKGGLSHNFGSTAYQDEPYKHEGVITGYSDEFENDTFVKGSIKVKLKFKSDCEDTGIYVRLSVKKDGGDYALRDDVASLSYFNKNYIPNTWQDVEFDLERHAFNIKQGEKLRLDISSSAYPLFLPHTNCKGLYTEITETKTAHNTVSWDDVKIILKTEK